MTTAALERACEHCGVTFAPRRSTARFHSDACRAAHARGKPAGVPYANGSLKPIATVTAIRADLPLTWEPEGEPRQPYAAAEPCTGCGDSLLASPRGTLRVCPRCRFGTLPAAAQAPYDRGDAAAPRQVVSQRERDHAAKDLAIARGEFRRQIEQQLADDKLHPQSRDLLEWYLAEVSQAKTPERLADLIEQARGERLRRVHWWQGQPAAIAGEAAGYDDDDLDDDDDYRPAVSGPLAIEAAPREMTPAAASGLLGWRLAAPGDGCQVSEHGSGCGIEARFSIQLAGGVLAWICAAHNNQICGLIARHGRASGEAPSPAPVTWADALAACGYRLHGTPGGCSVIDERGRWCGAQPNTHHVTGRYEQHAWLCDEHYERVAAVIISARRSA